jgi:hypothetical protein
MNNISEWAAKWDIDPAALYDLLQMMGVNPPTNQQESDALTETGVSKRERLKYAGAGGILWRNNVGALQDIEGRWVRYGLANDSKQMNEQVKSSDLIGVQPVTITLQHVGKVIGQFVAVETKAPDWIWAGTAREWAQHKFHQLVVAKGGVGKFSTGIDAPVNLR